MVPSRGRPIDPDLPWRVLSLLNIFRLLVPMLLLLVFFFDAAPQTLGRHQPGLFLAATVGWFFAALVFVQTIGRKRPDLQWQALLHLSVDACAMAMLLHASGGVTSGLATLLVLPTGATATILPRRYALLGTSIVVLALLVQSLLSSLQGDHVSADFLVTGLTGASLFAITLLALPVAHRLRESEALARQREIDLANLNELNEFIVQNLRESILVVDETNRVRLINEMAARLLRGAPVLSGTSLALVAPRLARMLDDWRMQPSDRRGPPGALLGADGTTQIEPHFIALSRAGTGPVLVFLEDTSIVAERAQQQKLAALGRLSASIAHEIRNPLGAMSHAGQLLKESPGLNAEDRHLTEIIEKNGARLSQIIENVLQLSRRDTTRQERIALVPWLDGFLREYGETTQASPGRFSQLVAPEAATIEVSFDPSHLHQMLWNLCDNAVRHGVSDGSSSTVEVRIGRVAVSGRPCLEVADRGIGVDPSQAERIFEPFFTTGRGGTGLGLFISRELCQTNGALLVYEPRPGGGSIFRVTFADPSRWNPR
ncbi:MAG: sensor histidine kinase [Steroidobacteraceae bacterium]